MQKHSLSRSASFHATSLFPFADNSSEGLCGNSGGYIQQHITLSKDFRRQATVRNNTRYDMLCVCHVMMSHATMVATCTSLQFEPHDTKTQGLFQCCLQV